MPVRLHSASIPVMIASAFAATGAPAPCHAQERAARQEEDEEGEEIVVQATRSGRLVQDEPIRVEVINQEEIEEKILMVPGNIAMIVAETGGVRMQVTSPSLGSANIRVQGMKGRYTQLLADGLPLYGGQASSIGVLQIPPTDLGQVEVIKGAASALYGPSALGGVINLVSRRPRDALESEMLLNATSRDGQDATAYLAAPLSDDWGASITGGLHRQSRQDLDEDGWIDMPSYRRWTVRPRLFWKGASGAKAYATIGAMGETRTGGTLPGRAAPDGKPFVESQDSERFDAGLTAEFPIEGVGTAHVRASGMTQRHDHLFGDRREQDHHETFFAEGSLAGESGETSWLGGVALQADRYRSHSVPAFDYRFLAPALFVQAEHEAADRLTLAGSARADFHNRYGTRFSPRVSALYRPGPWTIRASFGRGFYAPTPFVEEIEAAGLSRLAPLSGLRAETADSGSLEFGYKRGPFEASVTLFGSNLNDAVRIEELPGAAGVRLVNVPGLTRTRGTEVLLRYRWRSITMTGSYVHVDATEPNLSGAGRRIVPTTPHHTGGIVAMWEKPGRGRVGLEAYYTGTQALEDNPYRSEGRPYVELGALGELVLGKVRLFVNAENILGVRQTRYDRLIRRQRAADGRWTVDVWAPTDGFVLNGGVKVAFGGP